jgi:hypothetical protein
MRRLIYRLSGKNFKEIRIQRVLRLRAISTNTSRIKPPSSTSSSVKKSISRIDASSTGAFAEELNTVTSSFNVNTAQAPQPLVLQKYSSKPTSPRTAKNPVNVNQSKNMMIPDL